MTALQRSSPRLNSFLANATSSACVEFATARTGADRDRVAFLLDTYAAEVPVVLSLLENVPLVGRRLLDVGAGIGLTSFFLHHEGFDVTALEPGGIGFDLNQSLFLALRDYFNAQTVPLLSIGAESLSPAEHGTFDVMFSANVLEHVLDLKAVVAAMTGALSDRGIMIHTCPNYAVPYEPHYGMPLLPLAPALTPWAHGRKQQDVWKGLNFITAGQLGRLVRDTGLEPRFAKGTMARAIERLLQDKVFASRHPTLAAVARLMRSTGALFMLRHWPPGLATPLVMTARKG